MKKNGLKKILIPLVIIGVVLGVSACSDKTSQPTNESLINANMAEKTNSAVELTSGIAGDNKEVDAEKEEANSSANKISEASKINKTNINTIMNPEQQEDLTKVYSQAVLKTNLGDITLKFYPSETPITVNNFLNLAKAGFYNGTKFHRVIKDFMIQGGDPLTKESDASVYGTGGPGYKFKNEYGTHKLIAGNIAMANAGLDTNGSQFFIVTAEATPFLDGGYTNFGEVVGGMDVVRKIENSPVTMSAMGEMSVPVDYVTINSIELIK